MKQEVLDIMIAAVKAEIKHNITYLVASGMNVAESDQLRKAYSSFQRKYTAKIDRRRFSSWTSEYQKEIDRIWRDVEPEMAALISECLRKSRIKKITKDIRSSAAEAAITIAMEEAGLHYQIELQTYRAKVSVLVNEKSKVIFYINYKKMTEEISQTVIAVKEIISQVNCLGKGAVLSRAARYETWK